jgi:hypothetical protein
MKNPTTTQFQQDNLSSMMDIIKKSSKARVLARSLWHFFEHRLTCRRPNIDLNHANGCHIEIEQFVNSRRPGDLRPEVVIRQNARQEVGLVHELLPLNLIPLGFPTFRLWAEDDEAWQLAGGLINNADHIIMLPIFATLGYAESEFLGPSGPHTTRELRLFEEIEKLRPSLLTPRGYASALSGYLSSRSIKHQVIWIADLIVAKGFTAEFPSQSR